MSYEYIKFTGEYKKLKSMGFVFQRLFAGNYMQWCKDGIRIWKKGSDITYDEINLYKLLKLIEEPNQRWSKVGSLHVVKVYDKETRECDLLSYYDGFELAKDWMLSFGEGKEDEDRRDLPEAYTDLIGSSVFEIMKELKKMGWWEYDE